MHNIRSHAGGADNELPYFFGLLHKKWEEKRGHEIMNLQILLHKLRSGFAFVLPLKEKSFCEGYKIG